MAARAGASYITGGLTDKAGAVAPGINKAIDKVGDSVGRGTYKAVAAVAGASLLLIIAVVVGLTGGLGGILAAAGVGAAKPPPPTTAQCETMPADWCDVVYAAQTTTHAQPVPVPWTVLAGVVRVTTDYGRTSPYDLTDRDPMRVSPPFLATNYAVADTTGGTQLGTVPYNSGSLRWGVHDNGYIPVELLCPIPWAVSYSAECTSVAALVLLNEKYKEDHDGANLSVVSAYRDYAGQVYQRDRWCGLGSCGNAAQPGTSNHGWALAVDFGGFGTIGVYTDPDYVWMMANGPTFGWLNPPYMQAGGKGPLEPWHWEFHGALATGSAATVSTARAWGTPDGVVTGLSAADTPSSCKVPNPTTAIGGQGREASGPFLLLPAAAAALTEGGGDPQNPCDAAEYLATALADAAAEIKAEFGEPDFDDQEAAAVFWQKVIKRAGVVADPDNPAGQCTSAAGATVDAMISDIWECELTQASALYVVSDATTNYYGATDFAVYARATGQSQLIAEAKSVAWAASQYGVLACSETDATSGVFPLTAEAASSVGVTERCNPAENIRAAVLLVIAGESVPVADREASSPFSPMVGGWANIPAALGPDAATFPLTGPRRANVPTPECSVALDEYVVAAAQADSPFTALAAAAAQPEDVSVYTDFLAGAQFADSLSACSALTTDEVAAQVVVAALGHVTDMPGVGVVREGDGLVADVPVAQGNVDVDLAEQEGTTPPPATDAVPTPMPSTTPEPNIDISVPGFGGGLSVPLTGITTLPDPQALLGLAAWFNWQAQVAPESSVAAFGTHSTVQRLSTTGNPAPAGPVSAGAVFAPTAWQTRATEWGIFYGGLVKPFAAHGERTGSLVSSLTGATGQYAAVSSDTGTQVTTVIEAAKKYLGTPYAWAGGGEAGPSQGTTGIVGFDCSGLTEYAFAQAGYHIGGYTGDQKNQGTAVATLADAAPGDLLFFGSPIRHVGIYLGDNQMIHAPKPGDVVKINALYETPSLIKRVIETRVVEGGVDMWVDSALVVLYANGFPPATTDAEHLKMIIDHESSGNPAAVNKSDSNWVAGHPSFGLMQTIPSTFDAHALPSHTDKADPVAQIIAGARYSVSRYGSLAEVPGIKSVAAGQPYVGY